MKVCMDCGTISAFADLIRVYDCNGMTCGPDLHRCGDEGACLRRRLMKMGPLPRRPEKSVYIPRMFVTVMPPDFKNNA